MSRLLWFVLGGVATAVGAGIASVILDGESDSDSSQEAEEGLEVIGSQDDAGAPEQTAS